MKASETAMQRAVQYWAEAFGLAWALVGNRARAEELAQEAFVRLGGLSDEPDGLGQSSGASKINGGKRERPIRELLLKIVRNLCLDELRRSGVRVSVSLEAVSDEGGFQVLDRAALDPAEEAEQREQIADMRKALERFDPTWRAMLYLRDGLSFSYKQIAETLEKTEDVVRVTLHRARLRARQALEVKIPEGERS